MVVERTLGDVPNTFGDAFTTALNAGTQNQMAMQRQRMAEQAAQQAAMAQEVATMNRAKMAEQAAMDRQDKDIAFKQELYGYKKIADEQKAKDKVKSDAEKKIASAGKNKSNLMGRLERLINTNVAVDSGELSPSGFPLVPTFQLSDATRQKLKAYRTVELYDKFGMPGEAKKSVAVYFGLDPIKDAEKVTRLYSGLQRLGPSGIDALVHSGYESTDIKKAGIATGKYKEPILESIEAPIPVTEVDYSGYGASDSGSVGDGADDFFME